MKKFNVIWSYLIPVLYIVPILAYIILLFGLFFNCEKDIENAPIETKAVVESATETNTEPERRIIESKSIDISEEPTEEEIKTTEAFTETEPETEVDLIIETPSSSIESSYVTEAIYFDVPLESDLQDLIFDLCKDRGIDPAIIVAMIYRESGFNSGAIGDGGNSLGLMQIQPRWNGARMNELNCPDLLDPYQNVKVGIDCFADYVDQSGSIEWSLMAYNGGPSYASNLWNSGQISGYASAVLSYADSIRNNQLYIFN